MAETPTREQLLAVENRGTNCFRADSSGYLQDYLL